MLSIFGQRAGNIVNFREQGYAVCFENKVGREKFSRKRTYIFVRPGSAGANMEQILFIQKVVDDDLQKY